MDLPPRRTSTSPPSPHPQLPSSPEAEQPTSTEVPEQSQVEGNQTADNNRQLDWPTLTIGFCLGAGAQIAVEARKTDAVSFHLLCMLLVLAFSAIFVAKNIANKHADVARVLEHVGGFLGITAFFLAITIAFPLWLKVISWAIYALALLVIFICNYGQLAPFFSSPVYCC